MSGRTICRLCLESKCHNKFSSLENAREILDALSLNLDLQVTKDPVVCNDCISILQDYSDFMLTFVQTDNDSFSINAKDSSETDLVDVKQNRNLTFDDTFKHEKMCRFCSKVAHNECLTDLHGTKENMFIVEMLSKYIIPGVDLSVTEKLRTCATCLYMLKTIHFFILKCLNAEDKIKKYIELEGTDENGHVELNYVQETKPILLQEVSCDNLEEEKVRSDKVVNSTRTQVEIKDIIEERIKNEEIDIKSEANDGESDSNDTTSSDPQLMCKSNISLLQSENCSSHHQIEHKEKLYQCKFCPYQHRVRARIDRHMRIHMDLSEVEHYKCDLCPFATLHKHNLKKHFLVHRKNLENPPHKCHLCPFTTKREATLNAHMLLHQNVSDLTHKSENSESSSSYQTIEHKKGQEVKFFQCTFCPYRPRYESLLRQHIRIHLDPSQVPMHKCNLCLYTSVRKYNLTQHMLIHSRSSEVDLFKCDLCPFSTKGKSTLTEHMLTHQDNSKVETHKCEVCLFKTNNRKRLSRHKKLHKGSLEDIRYKCELCPYESKIRWDLEKHMLFHKDPSEVKMYTCNLCAYKSMFKGNLIRHLTATHRIASEITNHKCNLCEYQTTIKGEFTKHKLVHKGPLETVMWKCEKCLYETKYKSALVNHSLTHKDPSELKMFKCPMCPYEAKRKCYLIQHMNTHEKSL